MSLAAFISENLETIMQEWEAFAATVMPKGAKMDSASLRDDGRRMLVAIAADLGKPQNAYDQAEKSKGRDPDDASKSAATAHGTDRQLGGSR